MVNKKSPGTANIWRSGEGGSEITNSPEIILKTLAMLKKKRGFVALLHKGYQSGSTVLVGLESTGVLIDKPVDWPGTSKSIRVVFKDKTNVWNHFTVKVINSSKDTLKTEFPTELFRLQRRRHFRIDVPMGSLASFSRKREAFADVDVVNISAGGLLLNSAKLAPIIGESGDDSIQDVVIQIVADAGDTSGQDEPITVRKGKIVRETYDRQTSQLTLAVELFPTSGEEKELFKYVRWRELEMLRKGIKN